MKQTKQKLTGGFLDNAAAGQVIAALEGADIAVRYVGGCVRDALLDAPQEDKEIDMAAAAAPEAVIMALKQAGLKVLETGLAHGTVSVVDDGQQVEITSLRRDVETDGRHAEVAYGADWEEDAARRDFTFNALYADKDGTLFDFHNGLEDLRAGRVRFIGDAAARIEEDYLRILRFFRFYASHGQGEIDKDGLTAAKEAAEKLLTLSAERISMELLKIFIAPRAYEAVKLMHEAGILSLLLPGLTDLARFGRLQAIWQGNFLEPDPMMALGSLLAGRKEAQLSATRLKLSKAAGARLAAMFPAFKPGEADPTIVSYMSAREIRKFLYLLGQQSFIDRLMLGWSADPQERHDIQWRAALALAESWVKPEFPLTGAMMRKAGVPEGPEMGRIAREVERWWIEADFTKDVFSIIERLKAVVQATIY